MLGIEDIAVYLPPSRQSNLELAEKFGLDEQFIKEKIGVHTRTIRSPDEDTSDMSLQALERLIEQRNLSRDSIQVVVVVTQNPDHRLPHVSAIVHGKAGLGPDCAAFDISLGCSGYVYALSVIQSFMAQNDLTCGVLITCDPYSKIISPDDRSTLPLFGDAATATLISLKPVLACGPFGFGTAGDLTGVLVCPDETLHMNGREVFNFAATRIPQHVGALLNKVRIAENEIDCYIFHQGSKFIVETLAKRLRLPLEKVRIDMTETGNTVSSSIPILLKKELNNFNVTTLVLCGFGVGLSWASCICKRVQTRKD